MSDSILANWHITFEAPIGTRVLRGPFFGITTFNEKGSLWWDGKRWSTEVKGPCGTHAYCRSYKAFLRHLNKHSKELQGSEVVLVSRFVGHDITAKGENHE